ncbi:MAG TPA: alpha/beta hydrolase-fold protein [Marmoricola sp.]
MGRPLLVLLGLCTLVFPLLLLFAWPRLRHPILGRLGRLGLIALSQLSAVLLVAALLNDYGYFYGSWSDLFSGAAQAAAIQPTSPGPGNEGVAWTGQHAGTVTGVRPLPAYRNPSVWRARGRLEVMHIQGGSTQLGEKAYVYLPPEYFHQPHRTFPAVLALTGYPGVGLQQTIRLHYPSVLRSDVRRHRARPMILVMMRPAVTFPRDTECTDVPGGPQALSFFSQDVPTAIDARFRTQPDRWGAVGDSTGGYCAAKLAMTSPARFRAAVSFSGYFTALHDNTTGSLWGGSRVVRNLNNLDWRLQHQPAPDVALLVMTSRGEFGPYGQRNSKRFISLVKPPMTVDSIIEPHGGHVFNTWKPVIPESLSWLSWHLHHVGGTP